MCKKRSYTPEQEAGFFELYQQTGVIGKSAKKFGISPAIATAILKRLDPMRLVKRKFLELNGISVYIPEETISESEAKTILTASDFNDPEDERHDPLHRAQSKDIKLWNMALGIAA